MVHLCIACIKDITVCSQSYHENGSSIHNQVSFSLFSCTQPWSILDRLGNMIRGNRFAIGEVSDSA
jgi:hypothetical protein